MDNNTVVTETKIIIIEGIEANGELIMSDGGETYAEKSDIIYWDIGPDSGVNEIKDIQKKPNCPYVFQEGPYRETNSKRWKGIIKNEFDKDTIDEYYDPQTKSITEYYNIHYTKTGEGNDVHIYDPKIQVNS